MEFAHFDADSFLREYWQKRPLLIRNPWANWQNPLEPDELAGLACEDGVESRLIRCRENDLALESGPLAAERFSALDAETYTLLVQAVDQHVPAVAALIEPFRFVPNWRIDDVMASYAVDGGGVGPHYDQYDVFLIQGLGRRRWRVGPVCDATTPLLPHDDLRLIADFTPTGEWVLDPGDMLYVPPRYAHEGVAVGDDCMTYSIGFRAPSTDELVQGWCEHRADVLSDDDRYSDPDLTSQPNSGEITSAALDRLYAMVMTALKDRSSFDSWLGQHVSLPKYEEIDWRPEEQVTCARVQSSLMKVTALSRNPASRFVFIRKPDGAFQLFVDGTPFDCAGEAEAVAERICAEARVQFPVSLAQSEPAVAMIAALINQGSLIFEDTS